MPHDHPQIASEHGLIRRISHEFIVSDPKSATGKRLSSATFEESSDPKGGMSVDLENLMIICDQDPKLLVTTARCPGSVRLVAGDFRRLEFVVGYDPVEQNPYHGSVWGRFTRSKQRQLLEACCWYVPINGVQLTLKS
jgi:hypothetical protein